MDKKEEVLSTEFSEIFIEKMKQSMYMSFFKYGPIKENYGGKLVKAIDNLEIRLEKYKSTGNIEYLIDIANMAMIEYKYPQHPNAYYKAGAEGEDKLSGMTINEIKDISKGIF